MKECSKCGTRLPDYAAFCSECGEKQTDAVGATELFTEYVPVERESSRPRSVISDIPKATENPFMHAPGADDLLENSGEEHFENPRVEEHLEYSSKEAVLENEKKPEREHPEGMVCAYCGTSLKAGYRCCPECGRTVPDALLKKAPKEDSGIYVTSDEEVTRFESYGKTYGVKSERPDVRRERMGAYGGSADYRMGAYGSSASQKLLSLINSNLFLVFGIVYSLSLAYGLFSEFTFVNILCHLFPILLCIAFWMVYTEGRKGNLCSPGFSIYQVITVIRLVFWIVICIPSIILIFSIDELREMPLLILLVVVFFGLNIAYYWLFMKTSKSMTKVAMGDGNQIFVSIYIIVILCINVARRIITFFVMGIIQLMAQRTSSLFGGLLSGVDSGYGYGYDTASSAMSAIFSQIASIFGISQNTGQMLLEIVLPILEIILLMKLRPNAKK